MSEEEKKQLFRMLGWLDNNSRHDYLNRDELAFRVRHITRKIRKFADKQAPAQTVAL
jgi:hypothetical protein